MFTIYLTEYRYDQPRITTDLFTTESKDTARLRILSYAELHGYKGTSELTFSFSGLPHVLITLPDNNSTISIGAYFQPLD